MQSLILILILAKDTEEDSGIYLICSLHSLGEDSCVAYNTVCSLPIKEMIMKHPLCGKLQITHNFYAERPISCKTLTLYVFKSLSL